jgi:hypothetical protein
VAAAEPALPRWQCRRRGVPVSGLLRHAQFVLVLSRVAPRAVKVAYALKVAVVALRQAAFARWQEMRPPRELSLA